MSALWNRWMGEEHAVEFLKKIDADIRAGRWQTRQAALEDYAWWALGGTFPADAYRRQMASWLADRLLRDAEKEEELLLLI